MKKDNVLEQMIRFIKEQQFKKGDRLPAERQLGAILNASRTTVRESVRKLEERGLLTIKRGSGIYLNKNSETIDNNHSPSPDQNVLLKEYLEALYIIVPTIVESAALQAQETEILRLQDCIVRMSRAIVTKDLSALAEADTQFYQLLALMSQNHKLMRLMELLIDGNEIFWAQLIDNDAFVNNTIFAGYVATVNAIKQKQPQAAAKKIRKNLLNAAQWLAKIKNNPQLAQLTNLENPNQESNGHR